MMNGETFAADKHPIGVFDSGVGGLTVLRALMDALPGQDFIYLGDTARVPYGTKSGDTVKAYSASLTRFMLAHDVKMIVIACSTASARATDVVREIAAGIPVIDMIAPAVEAAAALDIERLLVMATQSTVQSQSYQLALCAAKPAMRVDAAACQVLVALAEEGWGDNAVARAALDAYIGPRMAARPQAVILGCTHFPLLRDAIGDLAGDAVLIDTGEAAAAAIRRDYGPFPAAPLGTTKFYVTDAVERFMPTARRFLGLTGADLAVEQVDITPFTHENRATKPGVLHVV